MTDKNLKDADTHFAFGRNWASYAERIGPAEIAEAEKGLTRLVPAEDLAGRSFLDIGCGSGLHALAASRLGVARILAVDIDADSVATTRTVLTRHDVTTPWTAEHVSVFDLDPARQGLHDVVYSWGVLHHTGAMWEAVDKAAAMVAPGGRLAIALYRSTWLDRLWVAEKRWYTHAGAAAQARARKAYIGLMRALFALRGRSFATYVATYRSSRGMSFEHDVHDWLGGYPYEAALAPQVEAFLTKRGFKPQRVFARGKSSGILGSGCDEFVYVRGD